MPQEEPQAQQLENNQQSQKSHIVTEQTEMVVLVKEEQVAQQQQPQKENQAAGKLKGTHSALVKLLESAPIAQIRPELKQKLSEFNGKQSDQNHYRKSGGELGTSKCPWKKSRICAEWLLKNQQAEQAVRDQEQQQASDQDVSANPNQTVMLKTNPSTETETMPKGDFTPEHHAPLSEDVEMTELDGLVCTCHELPEEERSKEDESVSRRNSSDSTDDEQNKCSCSHCAKQTLTPALLTQQHRPSLVSDSGCEDSDCAENKITDLCNRFNENLSKDDVSKELIIASVNLSFGDGTIDQLLLAFGPLL